MTEEKQIEVKPPEEAPMPPPRPPEEERPIFDLGSLLKARKTGGQQPGFWEVLAYMDYMDRKEDRMWRRQQLQSQTHNSPSPEVTALRNQVEALTKTVKELMDRLQNQQQQQAQKEFVDNLTKGIIGQLAPKLENLEKRITQMEQQANEMRETQPEKASALETVAKELRSAVEKLGEKAGASQLSLSDVDTLLNVLDRLQQRLPKQAGTGEVDWRSVGISTMGEIGKELVGAFKEIEKSRRSAPRGFQPTPQTPTPEAASMQNIIKQQLKAYILRRMKAGATSLNVYQAATELGLTPQQIVQAYEALAKEGWFHVKIPKKETEKKTQTETTEEGIPEAKSIEGSGQVFQPPPTT